MAASLVAPGGVVSFSLKETKESKIEGKERKSDYTGYLGNLS